MADFMDNFHTLKGYQGDRTGKMTESMEDYLEMICRTTQPAGYVRINFLASCLHVRPSSASKMVARLKELELVEFERYGIVKPTLKGWETGRYLLYRHHVLQEFFCLLNRSDDELEQVEQVEHFMNETTVRNLEKLLAELKQTTK